MVATSPLRCQYQIGRFRLVAPCAFPGANFATAAALGAIGTTYYFLRHVWLPVANRWRENSGA